MKALNRKLPQPETYVDQDPEEPNQEAAHRHAPALQHGKILDDPCRRNEKEEAVIPWLPAERISAPFSALDLTDPSSPQRITEEIERRRIHADLSSIMKDSV